MVTDNYNQVSKEELLKTLMKYSFAIYDSKTDKKTEKDGLSDIVNKNIISDSGSAPIIYLDNYLQQRLFGPYTSVIGAYLDKRIESLFDFTGRVPGKLLHPFPVSGNEGLFGFTYLGDIHAWRRDDLLGTNKGEETDIHECIHTPDEYETRVLTSWMMARERPKYIK
jgi:hypothetical protein